MAFSAHTDPEQLIERFDSPKELERKLDDLAEAVRTAKHFIVFTGAGISTSAGIPDFRGPNGVWTLAAQNKPRTQKTTRPIQARPTPTHMALVGMQNSGVLSYLVSQNCDGLHRKSGMRPDMISELHGNSNIEECEGCARQYFRDYPAHRISRVDHYTGRRCACGGRLMEWTVDFGQSLPQEPLEKAFLHAAEADVCLVLGSSLTVRPACTIPKKVGQHGRLFIANLQRTPLDPLATVIHAKTDEVMTGLCRRLGLAIPEWRLRRRFTVQSWPSLEAGRGGRALVRLQGREAYQEVDASLWREVRLGRQVLDKEPYEAAVPQRPLSIQLDWMGWYNEPPFSFQFEVHSYPESREYVLAYLPMQGRWEVEVESSLAEPGDRLSDSGESEAEAEGESWQHEAAGGDVPPPLLWPAACSVQADRPLFAMAGGTARANASRALSLFDPQAHTWANVGVLPAPRWGHSLTAIGPDLYLFGGWDSSSVYNDMRRVRLVDGQAEVEEVATAGRPPHRSCHSATRVGSSIYVFGGATCENGPYKYYADLWRFHSKSGRWEEVAVPGGPHGRSQHAMVALGRQLLLLGGYNGERVLNDTWLLDIAARRWTRVRPAGLPFPRQPRLQAQNFRVAPVMLSAARHGSAVYLHHPWGCSRLLLGEAVGVGGWRWEADQSAPADLASLGVLFAAPDELWFYKSDSADFYRLPISA